MQMAAGEVPVYAWELRSLRIKRDNHGRFKVVDAKEFVGFGSREKAQIWLDWYTRREEQV